MRVMALGKDPLTFVEVGMKKEEQEVIPPLIVLVEVGTQQASLGDRV